MMVVNYSLAVEPFCVAHRGNNIEELENSLASLESAANLNVHAIEFDIRHTLDGIPILMHDSTVQRVTLQDDSCPSELSIHDITLAEVNNCTLVNGESIPSLQDAFELLRNYSGKVFMELKDSPNLETLILAEQYFRIRAEELVIISFNERTLRYLRNQTFNFPFLSQVQLLHLKRDSEEHTSFHGLDVKNLERDHIRSLKMFEKIIGVYTKNQAPEIRKYFDWGVDFVTTDNPSLCMQILSSY